MKLAFSTNAFVSFSVIDAVEEIAAIGYEGVEILADIPHLYPYSVDDSELKKLLAVLGRSGLEVANLNANTAVGYYGRSFWEPLFEPSLANPDPTARAWRVGYTKRCMDLARLLGCSNISITSGRSVPGSSPDTALKLLRESLETVLEYAEKTGIRVGMEYEPGLLVERYDELRDLIDEMRSPLLGANLDLGHSHVLGEDPESVIAGLSSRIFNLHIEDIQSRKHYHLIPGLGDIDFRGLFEILERHAYDGFATVELYTYPQHPGDAARRSLSYLQGLRKG
jgi:sugar phosphate isomerase/epimerase